MRRLSFLFLFATILVGRLWAGVDVHISADAYPSAYLSEWETRTDMIQIEVQNTGTQSVTVKLYAEIIGQRQGKLLSGWGKPITLAPGASRVIASDEMVDYNSVDYNPAVETQILSTGRIPQDVYRLHVVAYEFQDGMTGANVGEDEIEVTVLGFDQPVLLSPDNEEVVQFRQIPFEWQPATEFPNFTVIYTLRIFEIRQGQTPVDAVQGNRVFYEQELENQTAFLYPDDAPDLMPGQQYVWFVQAKDEQGNPLGENEGKSDLFTFWYKFGNGSGIASQLQKIVLDQAMGYLEDLSGLQAEQNGSTYTFNGQATLVLNGLPGSPSFQATLEDLQVDLSDPQNPSILSGAVVVEAPDPADLGVQLDNLPISFSDLRFSTIDGFSLGVKISPQLTGQAVSFQNRLELTPQGPHGELSLGSAGSSTPVFSLGQNPVQLQVTQIRVHFSNPQVTMEGKLALFGQQLPCSLGTISFASGHLTSMISCTPNVDIPLVDGSDLLTLHIGSISGPVAFNLNTGTATYDFSISGKTNFKLSGNTVGADVTLEVKPNDVQLKQFQPNAAISNFPIDLGWLKLTLGNLDLTKLTWSGGKWDFNFNMNLNLNFPQFPSLNLPTFQNVSLGGGGFHLPSLSLPNLNLPSFDFGGFGIAIKGFSMPDVTFPWFSGGSGKSFDWGFRLSLNLGLPDLPGSFPACLKNPNISVQDVKLTASGLEGEIQGQALQNCEIPLGTGALVIQEVSGTFRAGGDSQLGIRAQLRLPQELQCSQNAAIPNLQLQLKPNGIILGQVQNLAPSCPFHFGPFTFQITKADLNFAEKNNAQSAELGMEGQLKLPGVQPGQQVTTAGILKYDLAQNKFVDGQIEVNHPFRLDIPSNEPFLSFVINHAVLDTQGVHISGASQLKVGAQTIPVNFSNLIFDPLKSAISGGSIQFSQSFSIKVGLQNGTLSWGVVPFQETLTDSSALRLDLAGNISLDASGLHVSGSSTGALRFNGKDLAALGVQFQNFAVGLSPVQVQTGSAKLAYNGVSVGELNPSGFIPDFGFFADAILPDQLPLPVAQVAYVKLRENNQLLVDVSKTSQGLSVKTRAGQPVKLVFPAFAANGGTPPEVDVEFQIVLNTSNLSWVSGSIQVTNANLDLTGLGLPFIFNSLNYNGTAFSFGGVLSLLGQQISGISLSLGSDNHLRGTINLPADFNFQLASNFVGIHLTSISSNFDADLSGMPNFQILANGDLNFALQPGNPCSTPITLAIGPSGFSVQNFNLTCNALQFDYNWVTFGLSHLAFQSISWDATNGWDFACTLSLKLGFPQWGIQLPEIQNVGWNKNGFQFPDVDFPNLENLISAFDFSGFQLQPLAFRMPHIQIPLPGSTTGMPTDWGFHFDFSMSMPNLPAGFPSCLRTTDLTVLNASFQDGKLNGSVEAKVIQSPGCPVPLGAATLTIQSLSGGFSVENGQQKGYVDFTAKLTLPQGLACGNGQAVDLGQTHLRITGDGLITGDIQNILPSCPLTFGPFAFTSNQSALHFSAPNNQQRVVLDLGGTLQLPSPSGGHVNATGTLKYDLVQNKFLNGQMQINQPFVWNLPQQDPMFSFVVQHAVLDSNGLVLNGGGSLNVGNGKTVSVTFNSLGLSFPDMKPKSGTATFSSNFALKIASDSNGLTWGVVDTNAALTGDFGVLFTLPQVSIVNGKLSVSGTGTAKIRYNNQPHTGLHVKFSNDFALDWEPFGVKTGKAEFYMDQDLLATVNAQGFLPGAGLLNLLPLPNKLPLPDSSIAYLAIKDASGHLRITTQQVAGGYQISGNNIPLVVPALAHNGTTPQWNITVNAVINPTDWSLVSGNIGVTAPANQSLLDLANLGLPLEVKALNYGNVKGHPQLMLSAKLSLPEALAGADLRLDSLVVQKTGISGSAHLVPGHGQPYLLSQQLGTAATVHFKEISATFSPFSCTVTGSVSSNIFADSSIAFTGALTTSSFNLQADLTHVGVLPLGVAQFEPKTIEGNPAVSFTVGHTFQMTLNGIFRIPDLNNMELTVKQLSIGSGGVSVGTVNISGNPQSFTLFGSQFQVTSLAFNYENSVFYATLGGTFRFMEQAISFSDLKIGSDGSFTAPSAVYNGNLVIVDPYLKIKQIGFAGDSLSVSGEATLPDPLVNTPQPFHFNVGKNGFSGNVLVTAVKETPQLGGGDQTELNFGGVGTLDVTYLALDLDFGSFQDSEIRGVFDFYIQNDAQKRVQVGENNGSNVSPGVSVDFHGNVNWGSVQFAQNMNFDYNAFHLTLTTLTLKGGDNFELRLSGNMGLTFPSVGGSIGFQDWGFSKQGVIIGTINQGSFTITNLVTIHVNNISYSGNPTTISLDRLQESSGNNAPQKQSATINVKWYFSMGADLTINNVGGGGIDQFLIFEDTSNNISFILKRAHLELAGTMQVQLDLEYLTLNNGFKIGIAGSGTFGSGSAAIQVAAAGKIAMFNGQPSFGLFALVAGQVRVPVGPGVVMTGFGGGFFYHPDTHDLQVVKTLCGMSDTGGKIHDPGNFAVFLFGTAAIVDDYVMKGSALITLTSNFFSLDAKVILLNMGDSLTGKLNLTFGISSAYVEGNVEVNLKISSLLTGKQQISFFFYGENAWAVNGSLEINVLSFVKVTGGLYVGPPGFLVEMTISKKFDIVIVSVSAGMDGSIWYQQGVSWGGYFKAYISASVAGGVASAKGWMEFAVLNTNQFYIYGAAGLHVSIVFVINWTGSVWAKIEGGGHVSGGFGSDPEMEKLIQDAKKSAEDMENAKNEAEAAMDQAKANASNLTPEEITKAGVAFITGYTMDQKRQIVDDVEPHSSMFSPCRIQYRKVVEEGLDDLPGRKNREQGLATVRQDVDSKITDLSNTITTVQGQLGQISVQVPDLQTVGGVSLGGSPLSGAVILSNNEHLSKAQVESMGFTLDQQAAANQQQALAANESQMANLDEQIHQQINSVWQQLNQVGQILESSTNSIGMKNQGLLNELFLYYNWALDFEKDLFFHYNENISALNTIYNSHYSFSLASAYSVNGDFTEMIRTQATLLSSSPSLLKQNTLKRKQKALKMAYFDDDQQFQAKWQAAQANINNLSGDQLKQANINAGIELWKSAPLAGNGKLRDMALNKRDSLLVEYQQKIQLVHTLMSQVETPIDSLYKIKARLTEILYDLYDQLRQRNQSVILSAENLPSANLGMQVHVIRNQAWFSSKIALLQTVNQTRTQAEKMLHVPRVTHINVTTYKGPFFGSIFTTFGATHADKVVEYSYQIQPAGHALDPAAWNSLGLRTNFHYFFANQQVGSYVLYIRARGSGGYTNVRYTPFTVHAGGWVSSTSFHSDQTGLGMTSDHTPPTTPVVKIPAFSASHSQIHARWESSDDESGVTEYLYAVYKYNGTGDQFKSKYPNALPKEPVSTGAVSMTTTQFLSGIAGVFSTGAANSTQQATGVTGQLATSVSGVGASTPLIQNKSDLQNTFENVWMNNASVMAQAYPVIEWVKIQDWKSAQGRKEIIIRHLELEHNRVYRVAVKAKNADNLVSQVGYSNALLVDQTPPMKPSSLQLTSAVRQVYFAVGMQNPNVPIVYQAGIQANWSVGTDVQSGIWDYQIAFSRHPLDSWSPQVFQDQELTRLGTFYNDSIVFVDTVYANVVSVNGTGTPSDVRSIPIVIHDPTPPTRPTISVPHYTPNIDRLFVNVTVPSVDPESKVDQYQVSIKTVYGGQTILPWTAESDLPSPPNSYGLQPYSMPGLFQTGAAQKIIKIYHLELENGKSYYVYVRAVNRDGTHGQERVAFFKPDATPPELGSAAVHYYSYDHTIQFDLGQPIRDPESGISKLILSVGTTQGSHNVFYGVEDNLPHGNYHIIRHKTLQPGKDYFVQMKLINGSGKSTIREFTVHSPDLTGPVIQLNRLPNYVTPKTLQVQGTVGDPESGIAGLAYQVVSGAYGVPVARNWVVWGQNSQSSSGVGHFQKAGTIRLNVHNFGSYRFVHGRRYRIFVQAMNGDSLILVRPTSPFTMLLHVPEAPKNVQFSQTGRDNFRIHWSPAPGYQGIDHFEYAIASSATTAPAQWERTRGVVWHVAPRLHLQPGVTRYAWVRAIDRLGQKGDPAVSGPVVVSYMDSSPPSIAWLHLNVALGALKRDLTVRASWSDSDDGSGIATERLELWGIMKEGPPQKIAQGTYNNRRILSTNVPLRAAGTSKHYDFQNLKISAALDHYRVKLVVTDRAGNRSVRWVEQ